MPRYGEVELAESDESYAPELRLFFCPPSSNGPDETDELRRRDAALGFGLTLPWEEADSRRRLVTAFSSESAFSGCSFSFFDFRFFSFFMLGASLNFRQIWKKLNYGKKPDLDHFRATLATLERQSPTVVSVYSTGAAD